MTKKKKTKPKISPEEYTQTLEKLDVDAIFLDACSVKANRDKIASSIHLDVRHKASYLIKDNRSAKVTSIYDLVVFKKKKRDFALKISCTYSLLFSCDEPITDDFMEIFLEVNIQMTTWPYFREFVQNMVQRTGLPPLTLPLFVP